ncbi:MAG TPA: hypothetical protein VL357_03230 [Rariglobus sp.]|jgi:hypothetical protein|nr:hypothetical protein [Rariglobus sp.]
MDVLGSFLDSRRGSDKGRPASEDWMLTVLAPEERLIKFDAWTKHQLATRLKWPADERRRVKLQGQCRARLERITLDLWRRGWLLDGKRLSAHIIAALDDIAAAQGQGRVKEFWPFFCRVVDTYVGINSETIQAEARSLAGAQPAGDVMKRALGSILKPVPTIPDLVAERRSEINQEREEKLRSRLSKARLKESSNDGQKTLF